VPPEILALASELAFPVLELPPDTAFADVINALLTRILNYQAELLLRSEEIHTRFTGVMLNGGGLAEIAALLAGILQRAVSILGADGELLATAGQPPGLPGAGSAAESVTALIALLPGAEILPGGSRGALQRKRLVVPGGAIQVIQRPIQTGLQHYGEVLVWDTADLIGETDLAAVEHAGTAAALAILKARAVGEVELRFRNDFLNDLLSGTIVDQDALRSRAEGLGWQLRGPYVVVTAEIRGLAEAYSGGAEATPTPLLDAARRIGRRFTDTARRLDPQAVTWSKTDSLIFLCPVPARSSPATARRRATWFAVQLQQGVPLDDGLTLTWGIGGFYPDLLLLHRGYDEARSAARIGRLANRPGAVTHYDDTGVYRLLQQFPDTARIQTIAREILDPLISYDTRHHSDLLVTVETYLAADRNLAATARALSVHYNTVKARIARIDDLLAGTLRNPPRRLELELAIQIWRLYGV
jgi:purine catabolism regulator